jgi:hypothetical protein
MSVNYRELLKDYIKFVDECEGVTCLEHVTEDDFGTEEWEALREMMDELGLWYFKGYK